jgi:hypothetical protein
MFDVRIYVFIDIRMRENNDIRTRPPPRHDIGGWRVFSLIKPIKYENHFDWIGC